MSLHGLTVQELIIGLGNRQFSVKELMIDCLHRIDTVDASIQAWAWLDSDKVMSAVDALEKRTTENPQSHPLHGIPVGIKDIIATAGIPTCMGSSIFEHHIPQESATVVHKLERSGALIVGKTVTTEFAFLTPGQTRNPWNIYHTPGGSSSGSAAAVAAQCIPAALGTQTQGSVIRPAAYCGVVGYKPSYGTVSSHGVYPLSPSLDHVGVLARNVVDASLIASQLIGYDAHAPNILPPDAFTHLESVDLTTIRENPIDTKPPVLALVKTAAWPMADIDQQEHVMACAKHLEQAGARVDLVDLLPMFDPFHDNVMHVMLPEVAQGLAPLRLERPGQLSDRLSAKIDDGLTTLAVDYLNAIATRQAYRDSLNKLFDTYDAIMTLATPTTAPVGLESTGNPIFCELWSLVGVPAIALPSGLSHTGLPLSLQLVGGYLQDHHLLAIAHWCEQHLEHPGVPPLPE